MTHFTITNCDGQTLRVEVTRLLHTACSPFQEITICDTPAFGRCLLLDGIIQTAGNDHEIYDRAMLERLRPADRNLLILGGGDGYIAELALRRNAALEATLVDLDGAVVSACREHLGQYVFEEPRLTLVIDDAVQFLANAAEADYDGIVCDLTDFPVGCADDSLLEFYRSIFALSGQVLKPGGWISVYAGSSGARMDGHGPVAELLAGLMTATFTGIERTEVLVPSFGEPSTILYAVKAEDDATCT